MTGIIGIGLSGLQAHQLALSVTGNNVANTNTEGYSRQQATFDTRPSNFTGSGYVGQGVNVTNISRIAEDFAINQLRSDTTIYNERASTLEQAETIDNLLASTTTGLTPVLSSFFEAFQGAADDPTSVPQRQLLLTRTEGLAARFESLDQSLRSQSDFIDQELEAAVSSINSLAQGLVQINEAIAASQAAGGGSSQPNELLDARDEALRQLSELVSVTAIETSTPGQVNVFIGNGQPLVLGVSSTEITTPASPRDNTRLEVALLTNGSEQIISDSLQGGKVGALLHFRDTELEEARNALGRVAIVVADTINEQHSLGMDLEDNLGGQFFTDVNDTTVARNRIDANGNNLAPFDQVLRANITDSGQLTTDTYEIRFEGPTDNDFVVVRLPDAEIVTQNSLLGFFPSTFDVEGFEIEFESGTYKVGDFFTVAPTRNGASDIGVVIDRVDELAFAAPIRALSNQGNAGNAEISIGQMLDVVNPLTNQPLDMFATPGQLSPPLGIQFISDEYYNIVDLSDPSNPAPLVPPRNNIFYQANTANDLFTTDPGETIVSASGTDTQALPAPVASPGPYVNGYGAQTLNFLTQDTDTGLITSTAVAITANESAESIATNLSAVPGVQANAYTLASLSNFVDDGDPTPLGVSVNGQTITVTAPDVFSPDTVAEAINNDSVLMGQDIVAYSDGNEVFIRALTGADIQIEVTGAGDSIDVNRLDPYAPGNPVLSTQTVSNGQGVSVGGAIDLTMASGVSVTATADTVFEFAPPPVSSYYGFAFSIQGDAVQGDRFEIEYNTGGVSDNRNALAIAALETSGTVDGGVSTYGEAYAQIVEEVGTVTNRARLDEEAALALLQQSQDTREAISGVNLDEEAGRLVQFQAAYSASAQVVSVARELFDTLLNAFN